MKFWKAMSNWTDGLVHWMWCAGEGMKLHGDYMMARSKIDNEVSKRFYLHSQLAEAENELKVHLVNIKNRDEELRGTEFENVTRNFWFKDHLSKLAERIENRDKGLE